jgi:hypothetical protein
MKPSSNLSPTKKKKKKEKKQGKKEGREGGRKKKLNIQASSQIY